MDNHNKEDGMVKMLKEDWERMDAIAGNPQVTQHDIQEQLHLYKLHRKRAFRKELSLFILTSVFILGLFVTAMLKSVQTILYIQVCAGLMGPVIYVFLSRREGKGWQ
jgi:lipopolysaccharide/colanic/teichoic acid biosynthesis glycosyltransferase